ncbi:DNA binding domain-containing protein, excisionase family [Bosea sp. OK403]|uniref:helix-turn-helix transcriptional regulator n=1 Tax=Bosea sp. OK403 TaxID=1855286 RepID=UPI0008EC6BEF|nr:helix-turn-helix transcriptional regulator [Bosea sp. OK403]SFJ06813.1 DNA binding domain-containing protein, excisionase family [Bosea sp. OK403]
MQDRIYLTTEEAAAYLRLKERKLYELVANGAVPCTKVSGKWLFPRTALDRWLEAGLARPEGMQPSNPPPIIGGSQDSLLEVAVRDSGCGLALLAEGSRAGLDRLTRGEVAIAAIHLHATPDDDAANLAAIRAEPGLFDAVVIGFARREQGLLTAPGNPLALTGIASAVERRARFARRQQGAGAQLLLTSLMARDGVPDGRMVMAEGICATGQDLALAIRTGRADCGVASRAIAAAFGLDFLPLVWEHVDLVMRRRTYFEPATQTLLAWMRRPDMPARARELGGYDLAQSGEVRLNR